MRHTSETPRAASFTALSVTLTAPSAPLFAGMVVYLSIAVMVVSMPAVHVKCQYGNLHKSTQTVRQDTAWQRDNTAASADSADGGEAKKSEVDLQV